MGKKEKQQEEEEDKKPYRGQPLRDRRDAERDRDLEVVDRALGPLALEHGCRELGRWCRPRAGESAQADKRRSKRVRHIGVIQNDVRWHTFGVCNDVA